MTWHRIDENTYIDDTLVTCAEYQLFIDEMREHGKGFLIHYKPDHWITDQFPRGEGHFPVLGMRFEDVKHFCNWLTSQEGKEWEYRIPKQTEAAQYEIKQQCNKGKLGYWTEKKVKDYPYYSKDGFTWVGIPTNNPRGINNTLENFLMLDNKLSLAFDLLQNHPFDIELDFDRADSRIRYLYSHLNDNKPVQEQARAIANPILRHPSYRNIDNAMDAVTKIVKEFYDGIKDNHLEFNSLLPIAIDVFFDIFTLQERIAGRSPAFEGIRLVKERIR